jgi:hypothetical protein
MFLKQNLILGIDNAKPPRRPAMPLYWLCYRHNNQISVVIEPGASSTLCKVRSLEKRGSHKLPYCLSIVEVIKWLICWETCQSSQTST